MMVMMSLVECTCSNGLRALLLLMLSLTSMSVYTFPQSLPSWVKVISTDGVRFTPRNMHATCVFNSEIWLIGGRTDKFSQYDLLDSFVVNDVWHSHDTMTWEQIPLLNGDFFAQNEDVIQPGPYPPFFARFGHTLTAIDIDKDGTDDHMILLGGYSPTPSNDIWVTEDGITWIYCGLAPWPPRAMHSTVVNNGTLFVLGGTPLLNDVWYLKSIKRVPRITPNTRSMFMNYTYETQWIQATSSAPWCPRCGMSVVSQNYFNILNETVADSRPRLVLVGGYGGFPVGHPQEDGVLCRADSWWSIDGTHWFLLNAAIEFGPRAWFGMAVMSGADPKLDFVYSNRPPKIFLFGGGEIGQSATSKRKILLMNGKSDGWYTYDGIVWNQINYQEGGGKTVVPYYSSQEWSSTLVQGSVTYLGRWGMTLLSFNGSTGQQYPAELVFIAGDSDGAGPMTNDIYKSSIALYCSKAGMTCGSVGVCAGWGGQLGCDCSISTSGTPTTDDGVATSDYCDGVATYYTGM